MTEERVGEVDHFFTDLSVGIVDLSDKVEIGDKLHFKGATTDFTQTVDSMEIDREKVEEAGSGDVIGLKVEERVREDDEVFKVED
ncbi:MAG: translation elongation factor-like protein [Candidatus Aenigmatarchaeota archaeon]